MKAENCVPATRPDEVPNHKKISMKWGNRENHMGKTLLQKEIAKNVPEDRKKERSWREPLKHEKPQNSIKNVDL